MRQQALRDAQSAGEGTYTGKFDAKKEAKKADAKRKANATSTYICMYLIERDLHERSNYSLGGR